MSAELAKSAADVITQKGPQVVAGATMFGGWMIALEKLTPLLGAITALLGLMLTVTLIINSNRKDRRDKERWEIEKKIDLENLQILREETQDTKCQQSKKT